MTLELISNKKNLQKNIYSLALKSMASACFITILEKETLNSCKSSSWIYAY